jgi:alanyl-tRNA synthetase
VERLQKELEKTKFELTALRRREMENLAAAIEPTEGNVCLFFEEADTDALRALVNAVAEKCRICAAFAGAEGQYRYIIASRSEDLRAMGKELNAAIGGRGGGNKESARAMFPDQESMKRFLETL